MKDIVSAEVIYINNKYYLRAYSVTTVGLRTAAKNPIHIVEIKDLDSLGAEVLKTLKECKHGMPHPNFREKQPKDEMLKKTNMKSDKELMKKCKSVGACIDQNKLEISPMFFNGEYLTSSKEHYIYSSLNPEDITKSIQEALEKIDEIDPKNLKKK